MARKASSAASAAGQAIRAAIAERAYYKAERRGFVPGGELDDWLEAEQDQEQEQEQLKVKGLARAKTRRRKTAAAGL